LSPAKFLPWFWAFVVACVAGHGAYLWWGQRLAIDTDILALLPAEQRDDGLRRAFARMVEATQQRVIVLIGADDWPAAVRAADAYRDVVAGHADLMRSASPDAEKAASDWIDTFFRHRLVLMTAEDETNLRHQSRQFWVDLALTQLYAPFTGPKWTAWQDDPFGLFANWTQARARETPVRVRQGRLFASDGGREYVVLPFVLQVPVFSVAGEQAVLAVFERAREAARDASSQAQIIEAGVVLHADAASRRAKLEISIIGIGSMIGIAVLTWAAFRSVKPIVLITVTIFIGFLGAFSVSALLFNELHIITLVFGASLIGVAEDYGIYFLCQRVGAGDRLSSWRLLYGILPALALTLGTSIIGYLGLVFTPFPGLHQMAVFSIIGLIFAWLTVVCWFPSMVRPDMVANQDALRCCDRWLRRWPILSHDRWSYLLMASFGIFALAGCLFLKPEDDVRNLQNSPQHLLDDQRTISALLDLPAPGQFYLVRGDSAETALQREETLKQRLDRLIDERRLSGYHAISNWVPSARLQTARRQLIDQALLHEDGALPTLVQRLGEDQGWIGAMRARLRESSAVLTVDDFLKANVSEPWRYLWLGRVADNQYAAIVALRGVSRDSLPALERAGAGIPGVRWVDRVGEISAVLAAYRRYMTWVLVLSYVAIFGILYWRYRQNSWRILAPTAMATIATVAFLGIAGHGIQLFHVLALMLLLGIGVDYGIFFRETSSEGDGVAWLSAGLSALSTVLSFGLLGFSRTPPLQAFGLTMAIGIGAVTLLVPCFRKRA
jgi:predicted exporter